MLDMLPLAGFLLWCQCLFSPLGEGLEFPLLGGFRVSPAVAVGSTVSLHTVGGKPCSTSRIVDYYSVEELGFQFLDRRDVTLLQGGAM
jgi:hypothetical protein